MQIELFNAVGSPVKATGLWDGSTRIVEAHGRYHDAVARGNCYTVSDTAGRTQPAGLSTAPIAVTLYNPLGSGVFLSLLYAAANELVAWPATAICWVGINPTGSVASTGTALAPQNCNGTGSVGKVKPLTTATLPAVPTIFADLGVGLTGAITVTTQAGLFRWFDGILGVGPGGALSIQVSTVSGSSGLAATWIWEEVPQSGSGAALAA